MSNNLKIIVVGNQGQLGKKVFDSISHVYTVYGTNRQKDNLSSQEFYLDFENISEVTRVIDLVSPDIIVNCVAYTNVDLAEEKKELNHFVNGVVPDILAKEAKRKNCLLIHISTDYVFDGSGDRFFTEEDLPRPLNAYGIEKLNGEKNIIKSECKYLILRTSWVYGSSGKNFVNTMIRLSETRNELKVVDDQIGAPTSVNELSKVIKKLIDLYDKEKFRQSGVYNAVCGGSASWCEFAVKIFECLSTKLDTFNLPNIQGIPTNDYPTQAVRPLNSRLSNLKLKKIFGIKLLNWEEALKEVIDEIALLKKESNSK